MFAIHPRFLQRFNQIITLLSTQLPIFFGTFNDVLVFRNAYMI